MKTEAIADFEKCVTLATDQRLIEQARQHIAALAK